MTRVYALCAVEAGYDLLRAIADRGVDLTGIIALSERGNRSAVSGFLPAARVAGLPQAAVIEVDDYRLLADRDRQRLEAETIDLLVVAGWQRLVPEWLIAQCRLGVLGLHGSARGISVGRGRSPQNWALLMGAPQFELAAFEIDPGVDSGPVLAVRRFEYTDHDDIASSYAKSMLVAADMIAGIVADWDAVKAKALPQDESSAEYLPQRTPIDGAIDWTRPARTVRALVAALTRPYPGAFCQLSESKLTVWRARPIGNLDLDHPSVPGEVVFCAGPGAFIVRVGDGFVMVDDYASEPPCRPRVGDRLSSKPLALTLEEIIARHRQRYPHQTVSRDLLAFAEAAK